MICILLQIVSVILVIAIPKNDTLAPLSLLISLGSLVVGVFATVFIFMLATKVYSTVVGVLLGVLTLIPCLGLIVLLSVNAKATGILRKNGIKVGLLGANVAEI